MCRDAPLDLLAGISPGLVAVQQQDHASDAIAQHVGDVAVMQAVRSLDGDHVREPDGFDAERVEHGLDRDDFRVRLQDRRVP